MARLFGIDLPNEKRVDIGLTRVYGIGRVISAKILKDLNIDDAVEQVLSLKEGGKDWADIAKNFGVELPMGMDALEGIKKLAPE